MPSGGELLIQALAARGVGHVFTVPGESFLPALDALHGASGIRAITCRNEAGAAMMAEATGKLTGVSGVALVTRGPGAANAVPGVYVAHQDASPMLLLVGLPPHARSGQACFQEIDLRGLFGGIAKSVVIVPDTSALPQMIADAFDVSTDGRPGPVVVGLPEDVLTASAHASHAAAVQTQDLAPTERHLAKLQTALAYAERPVVIVGGGPWSQAASDDLARFAERFDVPVVAAFRRQERFDNRHPCFAGHAGLSMDADLRARLKDADVVIALGTRLGDITSDGYRLFTGMQPGLKLAMIGPESEAPGDHYQHAFHIPACPIRAAASLAALALPGKAPPWDAWRRDMRAAYLAWHEPPRSDAPFSLAAVFAQMSEALPADAIVASGAGNYAAVLHRHFAYKTYPSQLAPISGSMGYGVPAAIAAKLAYPERAVVAVAGDGCFQMTGQELATAVQFGLAIVVLVADNGMHGTIRTHQEREFPGRVVATTLINPDFVALAQSVGATAERVSTTADFSSAFSRALSESQRTRRPALLELAWTS